MGKCLSVLFRRWRRRQWSEQSGLLEWLGVSLWLSFIMAVVLRSHIYCCNASWGVLFNSLSELSEGINGSNQLLLCELQWIGFVWLLVDSPTSVLPSKFFSLMFIHIWCGDQKQVGICSENGMWWIWSHGKPWGARRPDRIIDPDCVYQNIHYLYFGVLK